MCTLQQVLRRLAYRLDVSCRLVVTNRPINKVGYNVAGGELQTGQIGCMDISS